MGVTGKRVSGEAVRGVSVTEASFAQFGSTFGWVIKEDNTWVVFEAETGTVVNRGTWSEGYPQTGAKTANRLSTRR